jgi:MOSC domain-containing protein
MRTVARISTSPVQGFALGHPDHVELTPHGVADNRRFFLVDGEGKRLRSSRTSWPCAVQGAYDPRRELLRICLPDGSEAAGSALAAGETVYGDFEGRRVAARVVNGPWEERLSRLAGHQVRIARPGAAGGYLDQPVTLVSEASVARLAREAGCEVDSRRFRMLFTIAGCSEHEEDGWDGRLLRVGEAVLRVGGPVPRCAVTTRDPDTGERDLDVLRLIAS